MLQTTAPPRGLYADVAGGATTFFTMAYIVVVNPGILSSPGTGMFENCKGVGSRGEMTPDPLTVSALVLGRVDGHRTRRQQHDAAHGPVREAPIRGCSRNGPQCVLRLHDRDPAARAVAGRARHGVLGRRTVPSDLGHAAARGDRDCDPDESSIRCRGWDRLAADADRLSQRRPH